MTARPHGLTMTSRKRKHEAILRSIEAGHGGVSWVDVERLLLSLGAERHERSGSAVIFLLHGALLRVHRVHGRRDCGAGLVGRIRGFLMEAGVL